MNFIWEVKHRRHVHVENFWSWVARYLPLPVRRAVVVRAAVKARYPDQIAGRYCGPDGITYKDLWDNA
jgi:hypothetical protein